MTDIKAAMERWRQRNDTLGGQCKHINLADAMVIADACLALDPAARTMLAVLAELDESASYWSEYDVPCGIHERIKDAIAAGREALGDITPAKEAT